MQFTIESRELTNGGSHHQLAASSSGSTMIEAASFDDAIAEFVRQSASELMSLSKPANGHESIAMVKKDDCVFLVRVYTG